MAIGLVKDSSVARDGADQGLGGIVDGRSCGECAARPSKGTPNGGTHVLAVCAAPSELDYFVALALQQHGQQSALRKGRDHNFPFSLSKRWTIFAGIPFIRAAGLPAATASAFLRVAVSGFGARARSVPIQNGST
jgi:hypothetical protein